MQIKKTAGCLKSFSVEIPALIVEKNKKATKSSLEVVFSKKRLKEWVNPKMKTNEKL